MHGLEVGAELLEFFGCHGDAHEGLTISGVWKVIVAFVLSGGESRHRMYHVEALLIIKVEDTLGVGVA